ncbi:MAG: RNA polymerase sigma-54 factor [Candidatus Omnitrophica bacterium]|nr:RNA polymerase sigma-54 factor [Candidatus Omnitrophota bacterium]
MEPRIEPIQKQEQRLALTPQVRLGLRILQLSLPELRQFVEQQVQENPVLEEFSVSSPSTPLASVGPHEAFGRVDVALVEQLEQDDEPKSLVDQEEGHAKRTESWQLPTQPLNLTEHLLKQLGCLNVSSAESGFGQAIIENLDSNGYLEVPLEELAKNAGVTLIDAERCLTLIQQFDPPGVGARDLRECLLIQLRSRGKGEESLTLQVVRDHFELVRKRQLKAIARHGSASLEEVHEAFREIQALDPKPGRAYGGTLVAVLVPDAMIERVDPALSCFEASLRSGKGGVDGTPACAADGAAGRYEVSLRREEIPRLRISRYYRNLLKDPTAPDEVRQYLKEKVDGALWLMKAIGQRNLTLKEIVRCIACLEEEFLDKGPAYLKPLTLEQVAQLVGRHKSTVSRAIANKYVQTPFRMMRLDAFFGGGLRQKTGTSVAGQRIKAELQALIEAEHPQTPHNDQALTEALKARGIAIARRTVAKYRDELKILPSHLRKTLYD